MSATQGLIIGVVKDVDDPAKQGRIQVDLPAMPGRTRTAWAPIAAPMAGGGRGISFMPELEDEVIVGFLGSDPEQPVIMGFTWNGVDAPPSPHPRERIIRSLNGHTIRSNQWCVCMRSRVRRMPIVRPFAAAQPGREARRNNEYERCGTVSLVES